MTFLCIIFCLLICRLEALSPLSIAIPIVVIYFWIYCTVSSTIASLLNILTNSRLTRQDSASTTAETLYSFQPTSGAHNGITVTRSVDATKPPAIKLERALPSESAVRFKGAGAADGSDAGRLELPSDFQTQSA